ncbi:hypothetical protein RYA05_01520 [Pseudomonas syringae pv. actinidiae]|nr:hypothetical protein [Pseudomonas syringae pv. actinidiae]
MLEYKPRLIARIHACDQVATRIDRIARYDLMGKSEFDTGTGPSLKRMRNVAHESLEASADKDCGLVIINGPKSLVATHGPYAGLQLKVLVSRKTAEAFGESLWHTLKEISKGKYLCQATVNLDAAFSKYQNPRSFAAWHDIENDLFFSFSEAYLLLAKSILSQPIGDGGAGRSSSLKIDDLVTAVIPRPGLLNGYEVSTENWHVTSARVVALEDDIVEVLTPTGPEKIHWHMIINTQKTENKAPSKWSLSDFISSIIKLINAPKRIYK